MGSCASTPALVATAPTPAPALDDKFQEVSCEGPPSEEHDGGDWMALPAHDKNEGKRDDTLGRTPWILPQGAEMIVRTLAAAEILEHMLSNRDGVQRRLEVEAFDDLINNFPSICKVAYEFREERRSKLRNLFPLSRVLYLDPPVGIVKKLCEIHPGALASVEHDLPPFHIACRHASVEVVKYLHSLDPNAILACRPEKKLLPLHSALCAGEDARVDVVEYLLQQHQDSLRTKLATKSGSFAMHIAVAHGAPVSILNLLHRTWPESVAEARDNHGRLPLHLALMSRVNSVSTVKTLVEMAPETLSAQCHQGGLPLVYAASQQSPSVIKYVMAQMPQIQFEQDEVYGLLLHYAVRYNSIDSASYLARTFPAMTRRTDSNGDTPLHWASRRCPTTTADDSNDVDQARLIRLLIHCDEKGVAIKTRNQHGQTPLQVARDVGQNGQAALLLTSELLRRSNL